VTVSENPVLTFPDHSLFEPPFTPNTGKRQERLFGYA
jgi:hypothetical protein